MRPQQLGGGELPQCSQLQAWDDSHFSAEQDWVPVSDGKEVQSDTLWQWVPTSGDRGHLRNDMSGGHLNSRPEGYVRGHGNPPRKAGVPAPTDKTTELVKLRVPYDRFREHSRACRPGETVSLKFVNSGFVHVTQDGIIWAKMKECTDGAPLRPPAASRTCRAAASKAVPGPRAAGEAASRAAQSVWNRPVVPV